MKKIGLATVFLLSVLGLAAQDSWKISIHHKVLLKTAIEDEGANSKPVTSAAWNKKGNLEVCYQEKPVKKDWRRSILFTDENDQELIRKDGVSRVKIPLAELKQAFAGKKKIFIYTISIPTDPDLAARVRVRRVHLCTLELP